MALHPVPIMPALPGPGGHRPHVLEVAPREDRELARIRTLWDDLRHVAALNERFLIGGSRQVVFAPRDDA